MPRYQKGPQPDPPGTSTLSVQMLSQTVAPTRAASTSTNQDMSTLNQNLPPMAFTYVLSTAKDSRPACACGQRYRLVVVGAFKWKRAE